jgi:hypothetical protein
MSFTNQIINFLKKRRTKYICVSRLWLKTSTNWDKDHFELEGIRLVLI